ncbi:MAG: hypothetical protein AAF413_03335 [Patescibacteria group bacterium]
MLTKIRLGFHTIEALQNLDELEKHDISKKQLSDQIRYLLRSGRIVTNDDSCNLAKSGIELLEKLDFQKPIQKEVWDGKWRIISYDIPESDRMLRNAVRRLIKDLGMKQLQRSIWVCPYDCFGKFKQLENAYGKRGDILYIETDFIEGAFWLDNSSHSWRKN